MIFMPLIYTIGPIIAAFYYAIKSFQILWNYFFYRAKRFVYVCKLFLFITLTLTITLPVFLGLAALASGFLLSFGIILGLYYGFVYIGRVIYYLIAN